MQKQSTNPTTSNPKPPLIIERPISKPIFDAVKTLGLTELQARIVASRLSLEDLKDGHTVNAEQGEQNHTTLTPDSEAGMAFLQKIISPKLKHLQHPKELKNAQHAAQLIADAVQSDGKIVLATDYDTDGVTSAWVATRALIDYFQVPAERIVHIIGERKNGYGITDEVVNQVLAIDGKVDLVISADQGSSDEPRIQRLAEAGIPVCVTDHHQMAIEGPPASAACTVNPQQEGCDYDKTVAGCFVIFLVMGQTRIELIQRGVIPDTTLSLKDLALNVALGTVADSVSLKSINNRAIVLAGLAAINQFNHPAWQALRQMNDNQGMPLNAEYLGFQVATRINAASRVSDVTTAFNFLNASNFQEAHGLLQQLENDNQDRRQQQEGMLEQANQLAEAQYHDGKYTLVVRMTGNAGIQGIIASRIGERYGVPTIAMTDLEDGFLAGSGRGIVSQVDLRDAFQWMSEQHDGLFKSMGGHKGAAGCMIPAEKFDVFTELFEQAVTNQLGDAIPQPLIETDGELETWQLTPQLMNELNQLEPYGREWPKPLFSGSFQIREVRTVGQTQTHLSMKLLTNDMQPISAIFFNAKKDANEADRFFPGDHIQCAFQPSLNTYMGRTNLQLRILNAIKNAS